MDQLKVFLRQCVKYRFWIAVGVSLILPMIGYFVGSGDINKVTDTQVALIKSQQAEIAKYQAPDPPNADYPKLVNEKKAVLTQDVDAAWRKLYSTQEPLLKWPAIVEEDFRKWGRKWPENIDAGRVRQTIVDYTIAYPDFVNQVYTALKAWNPEDGSGIVFVPKGRESLVKASPLFNPDSPPELGKVWAEQERLWVITALLDAIARINDVAGAKDWDGAVVKQINVLEVATPSAQDQRSMAKGVTLEMAPAIVAPGASAPAAPAGPLGGPAPGGFGGSNANTDDVYSLKPESPTQPFKIVPIRLSVLVDQNQLQAFLVGLENSPMAIQVMEVELSKPAGPVEKPIYGEVSASGGPMGGGGGGVPDPGARMAGAGSNRPANGPKPGGPAGGRPASDEAMGMGRGPGGGGAPKKGGTDVRGQNKAQERIQKEKEAAKAKANPPKKNLDQYYNVVEVTVYGQARFYNAPPPLPASESSRAPEPPKAEAPKPEAPKPAASTPEAPKADAAKAEAPKSEAPKPDAAKNEPPKVEGKTPSLGGGEPPKSEPPAPKTDAPPKKP